MLKNFNFNFKFVLLKFNLTNFYAANTDNHFRVAIKDLLDFVNNLQYKFLIAAGLSRRWHVWLRDRLKALRNVERDYSARGSRWTLRMALGYATLSTNDAGQRGRLGVQNRVASLLISRTRRLCKLKFHLLSFNFLSFKKPRRFLK